MRNLKTILIILTISILTACSGIYENGGELASSVSNDIEQITVADLKIQVDSAEDFYLIDVRQKDEFLKGNIEGSFNIPRGILEFTISDSLYWEEQFFYSPLKDDEIIIYCKSGARGKLATYTLFKLGYTNVKNLVGGAKAWDPELVNSKNEPEPDSGCGG
ncbi:MAG: rhodanese-like domain-containing protein [Bacteroidota bacterium]|nr:rhodanese-like domain-containing protein [Bacteroidota bacterium]